MKVTKVNYIVSINPDIFCDFNNETIGWLQFKG